MTQSLPKTITKPSQKITKNHQKKHHHTIYEPSQKNTSKPSLKKIKTPTTSAFPHHPQPLLIIPVSTQKKNPPI
jgi:hypothetical protein